VLSGKDCVEGEGGLKSAAPRKKMRRGRNWSGAGENILCINAGEEKKRDIGYRVKRSLQLNLGGPVNSQ